MTQLVNHGAHHVALSVRSLEKSKEFYAALGFAEALQWRAADGALVISHLLGPDGFVVELFAYAVNQAQPRLELPSGNDLERVGIKHFAVRVLDIEAAYDALTQLSDVELTKIKRGRTLIDFFFACDPDGLWVEIVTDERQLDSEHPALINE